MRSIYSVCLLLLLLANAATAQLCRRSPNAGTCRAPSSGVLQEMGIATAQAYNDVMSSVVVNSQYSGSSSCGGGVTCKINASAQRARARALAPADAFALLARDAVEWYIKSVGAGCPSTRLLANYIMIISRWADKGGFLGKVSSQGVFEVDWKIVTIAAGYLKMKPYLPAAVRSKTETWLSKLYSSTAGRKADANNNHFIWHNSALAYSAMALRRDPQVTSAVSTIIKHMQQYITPDGVITTEARCTKTLHYHYFYLEAALGAIAGHKYYFGSLPNGWDSVSKRVSAVLNNINNSAVGAKVVAKKFGYGSSVNGCKPGSIQKVKALYLERVNGIYAAIVTGKGKLAPCEADSSYYGKFRYLPQKGANPPLGQVCC